jgi:HEAT repeat protein
METRQRQRTRAIAAAQAGPPGAPEALLALWPAEDVPAWRAAMLELLATHDADPRVANLARTALQDTEPFVRAAAVRLLGRSPDATQLLRPLLQDPVRSVRLGAAWILSAELPTDSPARRELDTYLNLSLEQPAGRMRRGQDLANRGQLPAALAHMEQAVAWDRQSPALRRTPQPDYGAEKLSSKSTVGLDSA